MILPGVIDADYQGRIDIVMYTLFPPLHIPAGSRVAQLVPIAQVTKGMTSLSNQERNDQGFGSTGVAAMLTLSMKKRPIVTAQLCARNETVTLALLLDTGADLTIIDSNYWPQRWPLRSSTRGVEGVGGHSSVQQNVDRVQIYIGGCQANTFVTVMKLPEGVQGLVGRDVLDQIGAILTTDQGPNFG